MRLQDIMVQQPSPRSPFRPPRARPPGLSKGSRGPARQEPRIAQGAQEQAYFSPAVSAVPRQGPGLPKPPGAQGR
ncbi:hypothetical protein NDU88_002042 [Pleurodeles waltl]|uniref:Uncharacterized protein n=1 Tax=Pleurodeles waltl TaxID=8319 RepID=A0AAV7T1E8_PLEWA|nr:hypothetical protein NDU88_002042 [Pleurodeles waltl]